MSPPVINRAVRVLLVVVTCGAIAWFAYKLLFDWSGDSQQSRESVVRIYRLLNPGLSREAVRERLSGHFGENLKLREISATNWVIQTPMEVGAANWDVWLEFNTTSLTAVRIRLADSKKFWPSGAPDDKEGEGISPAKE